MGSCAHKAVRQQNKVLTEAQTKTKFKMFQPFPLNMQLDIPVMQINDNLAYNFLVKTTVLKQKKQETSDNIPLFLYTKTYQNDIHSIYDLGFYTCDVFDDDKYFSDLKTTKVLFDFKTIWVFTDQDQVDQHLVQLSLQKFQKHNIKIKQINYTRTPLKTLLAKFKLSFKDNSLLKHFFPLQFFDLSDVLHEKPKKDEHFFIYVHGTSHLKNIIAQKGINIYQYHLQIRNILFVYENVDFALIKSLEQALYKVDVMGIKDASHQLDYQIIRTDFIKFIHKLQTTQSNVLIIHDNNNAIRECISEYMEKKLLIHKEDIDIYLDSKKGMIVRGTEQLKSQLIKKDSSQQQLQQAIVAKSRCDELLELYIDLGKKTKSEMVVQGCHSTILKLLENIIENSNDQKYRQIHSTNKKLQLNVFQYSQAIQILELVGFNQSADNAATYMNHFEVSMIKLARSDLELAYRRQIDSKQQK